MKKILFTTVLSVFAFIFTNAQTQEEKNSALKLINAFSSISNLYVDGTSNVKIVEDAIKGMLTELDPHSSYTNAEETRKMNEPLEANFDGIGIQFNMLTDTLYVVQVISGGPSEKVGLVAGDRIIMVDDSLIAGVKMNNTDVIKMIRGEKGTEVRVKVKRGSLPDLLEFKIIRDRIPVFSLDAAYMADKKTGYIRLSRFAASTVEEFEKAFLDLKKKGMQNLILDLQGNGGGYLNTAFVLSDEFLDRDKLIVYTEGHRQPRSDANATGRGVFENGKLIILVDEYSASASEIVSGAVQDWDRGVIVGRRTFGKGLVQRPIVLPDSSMIRLTTARYYTPSGRNIQKPYETGNPEAYSHELAGRYNSGELMHADSIHFPDSLKYSTLVSKRTVYGGGGIMPDVFIPLDSTRSTDYHSKLVRYNIISRVIMNYMDRRRTELGKKYPNIHTYREKFTITEDLLQELQAMAKEEKIEFNEEQYNRSKELISLQLKALIANDLFEEGDYFQIINDKNDSYQEALKIINDDDRYHKILAGNH
ncbi:MAG: S41 family peptidase [Tannerella sp.]|jgi:carboxyl-terminal processing protease|nr:S41 family peptidase [Tannerella sp.]